MANTDDKDLATHGDPPKADKDINQPGMTNGVPDDIGQGDSLGRPSSQRLENETTDATKDADHD